MRVFIVLFLIFSSSLYSFTQKENEEVIDGYVYKIHIVEKGNTLYQLQQEYNVDVETIKKSNASLKDDGLAIGQRLLIPFISVWEDEPARVKLHEVQRKETAFGIAKTYNCKLAELIHLNNKLESGLNVGEILYVPVRNKVADITHSTPQNERESEQENKPEESEETVETNPFDRSDEKGEDFDDDLEIDKDEFRASFPDSILHYEVKKGETLYSISKRFMVPIDTLKKYNDITNNSIQPEQILKIKLKQEHLNNAEIRTSFEDFNRKPIVRNEMIQHKNKYKILVALPMKLNQNREIISEMYDEKSSLNMTTDLSVSFLMGAQMAIDSLKNLGLNGEVEFFDTEGNLDRFKNHIGVNEKRYDLIVGPFYQELIEYAATWGFESKTPVISVTKIPTKYLENNPYLMSTVPSDLTLIRGMAKYLAKTGNNVVLIEGVTAEEKEKVEHFKNVYADHGGTKLTLSSIGNNSGATLGPKIIAQQENYVVCFSNDVQRIMTFVTTLNNAKNTWHRNTNINMVGLKDWDNYSTLTNYYKNRFNFHYASANYLNYSDNKMIDFNQSFRDKYGSEPSRFAVHGFDVMLSQVSYLLLGMDRNRGLMDSFNLQQIGSSHGFENTKVFIIRQDEFELELLEIIE
ncbi:MAG: LysM peptidoglycan-binding domain-containing protein [Brumimicrobium sp.]